ncbi:CheA signal transduction histidine kinase [Ammonifex degensii KC4]|uniref:Chemotaxis protein CheA n=1 Tax=Ammonifex degensii (strain DSM 10501 / KC4) TaxID=429009 RepID=C9RAY6_AMMDK|nr:chemotaxis protein CheA [Ammonifex degensii]ACX51413.1 CheA signal transduction histidine kinase [Ammonifex degensii KC4]
MFDQETLGVFLDELEEKIQAISDNLLVLEREGGQPEALQEIFRAAHTIKGSSAIMGFEDMSNLTHEMENLLDLLRRGELEVTPEVVDTLFEALDVLKALRDRILDPNKEAPEIGSVVAKLKGFREAKHQASPAARPAEGTKTGLTEAEEATIYEAQIRGFQAYRIKVTVAEDCQMKGVRAFLVFRTLEPLGEIIKAIPPVEELEEGEYERSFELVFLTKEDPGRLRHLLLTVSEIVEVEVTPITLEQRPVEHREAAATREEKRPAAASSVGLAPTKTVRVDVQKLDELMNLVGELVINRTRLDRIVEIFLERYGSDDLVEVLEEVSNHLGQLTNELQEQIMKARMLPVGQLFNRFPRMVRDLAHKLGKEVNFVVEGKETELDRNVIEVIGDPLIHLLRNAVDHGIEPPEEREALGKPRVGTIRLKAYHQENHIVIEVEDDGRGIDTEKVRQKAVSLGLVDPETASRLTEEELYNFIFQPGFSTATQVTDLSGRGVGMDVVRKQIEQINGTVEVSSRPGQGTKFSIKLPLTLAIIRALMVSVEGQTYAFPLTSVLETLKVSREEVRRVKDMEVVPVRGSVLPLFSLAELFGGQPRSTPHLYVVVVNLGGGKRAGLVVDELLGEQEIVIKSLGEYLGRIPGIAGATILGDGRVALILDVRGLIQPKSCRLETKCLEEELLAVG